MKITNETKVGILALAAIVVLVVGFNFLKGQNIFNKPPVLYARFENIGGLDKSNPVKINGLPVGTVFNISQGDAEVNWVVVEIHLTRDIRIPRNSVAFIDASLLGTSFINIEKGEARSFYKTGDTLDTRLDKGLIGNLQSQLAPTLTRVNTTLDSLTAVLGGVAQVFDERTNANLQTLVGNLTTSSAYLSRLLNTETGQLASTMSNLNSVTGNLARNNDAINSSIRNVEVTTSKIANANIEGTVAALQGAVGELRNTIANLNSKNGSLGLLMNDRQLYDQLNGVADRMNKAALAAEITIDDLRLHPKRYVNFSVFGGKNKGQPLSSPAAKDSLPAKQR